MANKGRSSGNFSDFESYDSKHMREFIRSVKEAKQELSSLEQIADGFSSTLLGINFSSFNKEVPKSASEIRDSFMAANSALINMKAAHADLAAALTQSTSGQRSAVDSFTSSMRNAMNSIGSSLGMANEMASVISKMSQDKFDLSDLLPEEQAVLFRALNSEAFDFIDKSLSINDQIRIMNKFLSDSGEEIVQSNADLAEMVARHRTLNGVLDDNVDSLRRARIEHERLSSEARETTKEIGVIGKLALFYKEWSNNFLRGVGKSLVEINQTFKELQRNAGIDMSAESLGDSARIADWSMKMNQFGMSTKDSTEMLSELSDQLKTTNRETLMDSAERLSAIPMALGLSVKEVTDLSGELMRAGQSAEQVEDYFRFANKNAKMLGVNSKAVVKQITGNIEKMRQFGFVGGEKSLARMAAKAEMLRIKVDSIFDVAKRARTIEGAMDMASQLQLAGGSFSRINPMELLSAARKGPEELGKILTSMGSDVGSWVKDMNGNETFQFNPLDVDRLGIVAEATGMELDQLQKMIQKNAEISRKTSWLGGDDMFRGVSEGIEGMDSELAKARVADLLTMGKDGQLSIDTSKLKDKDVKLLDQVGIKSISDLNESNIKELLKLDAEDKANLEEQAKQNMSLKESLDAFVSSLTNAFVVFQPAMDLFTEGVNKLNSMGSVGKIIVSSSVVALGLWKTGMFGIMKSFGSGIKNIISRFRSGGGGAPNVEGSSSAATEVAQVSNIAQSISLKGIAKFGLALATMGAAIIGFTYALDKVGGEPSIEKLGAAAASIAILGGGLVLTSRLSSGIDPKGLLQMAGAMALIGVAMVPFAYAAQEMTGIDWGSVLKGLGVMALSLVALTGIGALLGGGLWIPLAIGAASLAGVGVSLDIAAQGILASGLAFEKLTKIDWSGMDKMGSAMMKVAPALGVFALSAMAFANPISIIGIAAMTASLWALSKVITPMVSQFDKSSLSIAKMNESILSLIQSFDPAIILSIFGAIGMGVKEMDKSLKGVDVGSISGKLSKIKVAFDTSSIDEVSNKLTGIKDLSIGIKPKIDVEDKFVYPATLGFDSEEVRATLDSIVKSELKISSKLSISNFESISEQIRSLSGSEIIVKTSGIDDLKNIGKISLDESTLSSLKTMKIGVDESQLLNAVSKYRIGVDIDQFAQLSSSLQTNDLAASIAQFSAKVSELTVDKLSVVGSEGLSERDSYRNDGEIAAIEKLSMAVEKLNETMSKKSTGDQGVAKIKLDLKMNGRDIKYRILEDTKLLV